MEKDNINKMFIVLQCVAVAVCCSVMQCVAVAVCCSVLQCVAVCCRMYQAHLKKRRSFVLQCSEVHYSVLKSIAECFKILLSHLKTE